MKWTSWAGSKSNTNTHSFFVKDNIKCYPDEIICFSLFIFEKKSLIRFNHDNFLTLPEADLQQWLIGIALSEGYAVEEVEYNFVDAEILFSLNKKYLNHETHTDIITFDYSESKAIKAEAYISLDALKIKESDLSKL